jgi:hypothetical protein
LVTADGTTLPQRAIAVGFDAMGRAALTLAAPRQRADGTIELRYGLARQSAIDLAAYDLRGRRVASIVSGDAAAGSYLRSWRAPMARGAYVLRLEAAGARVSRKLVLLRRQE